MDRLATEQRTCDELWAALALAARRIRFHAVPRGEVRGMEKLREQYANIELVLSDWLKG